MDECVKSFKKFNLSLEISEAKDTKKVKLDGPTNRPTYQAGCRIAKYAT